MSDSASHGRFSPALATVEARTPRHANYRRKYEESMEEEIHKRIALGDALIEVQVSQQKELHFIQREHQQQLQTLQAKQLAEAVQAVEGTTALSASERVQNQHLMLHLQHQKQVHALQQQQQREAQELQFAQLNQRHDVQWRLQASANHAAGGAGPDDAPVSNFRILARVEQDMAARCAAPVLCAHPRGQLPATMSPGTTPTPSSRATATHAPSSQPAVTPPPYSQPAAAPSPASTALLVEAAMDETEPLAGDVTGAHISDAKMLDLLVEICTQHDVTVLKRVVQQRTHSDTLEQLISRAFESPARDDAPAASQVSTGPAAPALHPPASSGPVSLATPPSKLYTLLAPHVDSQSVGPALEAAPSVETESPQQALGSEADAPKPSASVDGMVESLVEMFPTHTSEEFEILLVEHGGDFDSVVTELIRMDTGDAPASTTKATADTSSHHTAQDAYLSRLAEQYPDVAFDKLAEHDAQAQGIMASPAAPLVRPPGPGAAYYQMAASSAHSPYSSSLSPRPYYAGAPQRLGRGRGVSDEPSASATAARISAAIDFDKPCQSFLALAVQPTARSYDHSTGYPPGYPPSSVAGPHGAGSAPQPPQLSKVFERVFDLECAKSRHSGSFRGQDTSSRLGDKVAQMIAREQELYGEYVVFYHSYNSAAVLYEVNAVLAHALYGTPADSPPLPRLLREPFDSLPSMDILLEEFSKMRDRDENAAYRNVAVCVSNSLFATASEAPPLRYFDAGYCIATNMTVQGVLASVLAACGLDRRMAGTVAHNIMVLSQKFLSAHTLRPAQPEPEARRLPKHRASRTSAATQATAPSSTRQTTPTTTTTPLLTSAPDAVLLNPTFEDPSLTHPSATLPLPSEGLSPLPSSTLKDPPQPTEPDVAGLSQPSAVSTAQPSAVSTAQPSAVSTATAMDAAAEHQIHSAVRGLLRGSTLAPAGRARPVGLGHPASESGTLPGMLSNLDTGFEPSDEAVHGPSASYPGGPFYNPLGYGPGASSGYGAGPFGPSAYGAAAAYPGYGPGCGPYGGTPGYGAGATPSSLYGHGYDMEDFDDDSHGPLGTQSFFGHTLQVFVHKDLVDHCAYVSLPYGEPTQRRTGDKSSFSQQIQSPATGLGQARVFMHPENFIAPNTRSMMFHYSASADYDSPAGAASRTAFHAALQRELAPLIGSGEALLRTRRQVQAVPQQAALS